MMYRDKEMQFVSLSSFSSHSILFTPWEGKGYVPSLLSILILPSHIVKWSVLTNLEQILLCFNSYHGSSDEDSQFYAGLLKSKVHWVWFVYSQKT